jgi:hypothetical protein
MVLTTRTSCIKRLNLPERFKMIVSHLISIVRHTQLVVTSC